MRIRTFSAVAAVATLAACGGSDGGPAAVPVTQPSKDTIFTIGMTAFSPAALPVSVGATVVFALGFDGIGHDVQFAAAPGSPAYVPVTVRSYVRVAFPTAGTFPYTCPTHPQMTGTITVR